MALTFALSLLVTPVYAQTASPTGETYRKEVQRELLPTTQGDEVAGNPPSAGDEGGAGEPETQRADLPTTEAAAGDEGADLPFTGFELAMIGLVAAGLFGTGLALRRSRPSDDKAA